MIPPPSTAFDDVAAEYERLLADPLRSCFAADRTFFIHQKCRAVLREMGRRFGSNDRRRRVLDVGCGLGTAVAFLQRDCRIVGSDVSLEMLRHAASRGRLAVQEPLELPFADSTFDAAFAFCVYHHIDERDHVRHLRELARVVRPDGLVLVFEHNPLNPVTQLVFRRAPIDRGCRLIRRRRLRARFLEAGLRDVRHGYVLFVPEFLSRFAVVESYLRWLPLGGQYYVCGRRWT